jgi:hypothetical protein
MQRNSAYQETLLGFAYLVAYAAYVSLSSIYLMLPPLFGLLFVHFIRALDKQQFSKLMLVSAMLVLYEIDKSHLMVSSLVYFALLYHFVVPKFRQYIDCHWCLSLLYILSAYLGFWLFSLLISKIFWMNAPTLDWHVILYIVIEFLLVALI